MTDEKNTAAEMQEQSEEEQATVTEEAVENIAETETKADKKKCKKTDAKLAELEKKLVEKDAEIAEINDKYMRMMAEYDNFRKRSAKEKEGTYADAYADALNSIIPIIDNLERAVGVTDADGILKGLEMTLKGAADALTKMGVEAFGAEGDAFDPNIHNAVMHTEDPELGENVISQVFQKGFKLGDKIVRFAMVQVAN